MNQNSPPDDKQELIQKVVQNLLSFKREWRVQNRRLQEEFGLSSQKIAILRRLASDGPMTVGQIADHFYVSCPTASEVIDGLTDLGLVTNRIGVQDARRRWIEVTEQGRSVIETAPLTTVERIRIHLASLGIEEIETVGKAISEITSCIGSEEDSD